MIFLIFSKIIRSILEAKFPDVCYSLAFFFLSSVTQLCPTLFFFLLSLYNKVIVHQVSDCCETCFFNNSFKFLSYDVHMWFLKSITTKKILMN